MKAVGLDFGERTIGVAMSDGLGLIASAHSVLRRKGESGLDESISELKKIIEENGVTLIVLGFPVNMNNTQGFRCEKTLEFKTRLEKSLVQPIILQDERLSTVSAERTLLEADVSRKKRKKVIDKMAAVFILQQYLDSENNKKSNDKRGATMDDEKNKFEDELDDLEAELDVIVMTTEDGDEVEFIVIDSVEHEGSRYLLVVEAEDDDDEESDAYIFKEVNSDDNECVYEELTDEEFEKVSVLFKDILEEFDIEEE